MNHGSLFSGIGGFDLAAEWMGWNNVFQLEKDEKCQLVLEKNFPETKKHRDIYEFQAVKYRGRIDIVTGGFPCQPFSTAGKRQGEADDRYLWPEMLRVIKEIRPRYIVAENVPGLLSLEGGKTFEGICASLEDQDYTIWPLSIPACSVGARHKRQRVWIVAHANSQGKSTSTKHEKQLFNGHSQQQEAEIFNDTNAYGRRQQKRGPKQHPPKQSTSAIQWPTEPAVCRTADGVPGWTHRLKQLGNAIVPQVAFEIFKTIQEYDRQDILA